MRRGVQRVLISAGLVGASVSGGLVAPAQAANRPVRHAFAVDAPLPENPAWKSYVEAPAAPVVQPVRVVSVSGAVSNPGGLLADGAGTTTLSYPAGGTAPVVVLDYGKEIGGYIQFGVAAQSGSPTLHAAYSEALANLTPNGDGALNFSRADSFSVTHSGAFEMTNLQGGQRYEEITLTSPGTVTLSSATTRFSAFRGTPDTYEGYFLSSSDLLNRIWYAGAYTVNLDQVLPGTLGVSLPIILDGAKRDRALWVGDLGVEGPTILTAFGKTGKAYMQGSMGLLGRYPQNLPVVLQSSTGSPSSAGPMPGSCSGPTNGGCYFYSATYSMDFVLGIYQDYLYTADRAFLAKEWPMVQREIAWENSQMDPATGLFMTTAADSADWAVNFTHPAGEYTAPSVLHYESLLNAAALAQAMGDGADAATWRADAAAVKSAVNLLLWDPVLGAYDASTAERGFLVQDANSWAALYGIADPTRAKKVLHTLASKLSVGYGMLDLNAPTASAGGQTVVIPPDYGVSYVVNSPLVSPYISSFTLWADYQNGEAALGDTLLKNEWGTMVNGDPGGVDWERMQTGGVLGSSDSAAHGWGTGATPALTQHVLGIEPTSPGFATWSIKPQTGRLAWAQGRVPTPRGPVDSRWAITGSAEGFKLTMSAPEGTSGEVVIPELGRDRTIYEDGQVIWQDGAPAAGVQASDEGDVVHLTGVTGSHTFAWGRS